MNESELLYLAQNNNVCNLTCPHCNTLCKFEINYIKKSKFKISKNIFGVIMSFYCPSCENSFTYLMEIKSQQDLTKLNYDFFSYGYQYYINDKDIKIISIKQIFPREKTIAKTFPDYVPKQLITFYEEMCELYLINNNATAIWARKWVEKFMIIESSGFDKNELNNKTLDEKITLFNQNSNTSLDASILTALRRIGNKTVHIFSSNEDVEISQSEASLIITNIEYLIKYYYIVPHEKELAENALLDLEKTVVDKSNELSKQ